MLLSVVKLVRGEMAAGYLGPLNQSLIMPQKQLLKLCLSFDILCSAQRLVQLTFICICWS